MAPLMGLRPRGLRNPFDYFEVAIFMYSFWLRLFRSGPRKCQTVAGKRGQACLKAQTTKGQAWLQTRSASGCALEKRLALWEHVVEALPTERQTFRMHIQRLDAHSKMARSFGA